jgi:hypothetical protein
LRGCGPDATLSPMPLTQPERDNPLMRRYFDEIGLPGKRLAQRCGVSHSQIYIARTRNVGADNARKIARGMGSMLGLSDRERPGLAAEIRPPSMPLRVACCASPSKRSS